VTYWPAGGSKCASHVATTLGDSGPLPPPPPANPDRCARGGTTSPRPPPVLSQRVPRRSLNDQMSCIPCDLYDTLAP
jgi:hypothetical protein